MKKKIEEIRKENGLIFRPDITEIVVKDKKSQFPEHKWTKKELREYQVYEKEGFLYYPEYESDESRKIKSFESLGDMLWDYEHEKIKKEIRKKFNVKISKNGNVVCNCGLNNHFLSHSGNYELILECDMCGHKFCAYSG